MIYEHLRFAFDDGVAILTLDRPDQRNAFSGPMATSLAEVYRECDARDDVRAVIDVTRATGAEVLDAAIAMARDIAGNTAPLSVALSKRLLWESRSLTREEVGASETNYHHLTMGQPDAIEGVMAFLERRPPQWRLAIPRDWPEE